MDGSMTGRLKGYTYVLHPVTALSFSRPLVIFQSDDWGLVGIRDAGGFERLRSRGVPLGRHPRDYYSLETPEDLSALYGVLLSHKDSAGNSPVFVFNFVLANVDFEKVVDRGFLELFLKPLCDGLPSPWKEEGLLAAYGEGISAGLVCPALHGVTHFCRRAVEEVLKRDGPEGKLTRLLMREGSPLAYEHTPWAGFEYRDEGKMTGEGWLDAGGQTDAIELGIELFGKTFGRNPLSACAPGYRANPDTFRLYAAKGIRVVQNGPGIDASPYIGRHGLLHLHRNVSFEPALDPDARTAEKAFKDAVRNIEAGRPAVVCMHSVNFHSRLRNYRDATIEFLDDFLARLENRFDDLLYLSDEDLLRIADTGHCGIGGEVSAGVDRRRTVSPVLKDILKKKIGGGMTC